MLLRAAPVIPQSKNKSLACRTSSRCASACDGRIRAAASEPSHHREHRSRRMDKFSYCLFVAPKTPLQQPSRRGEKVSYGCKNSLGWGWEARSFSASCFLRRLRRRPDPGSSTPTRADLPRSPGIPSALLCKLMQSTLEGAQAGGQLESKGACTKCELLFPEPEKPI
jgi:hypothetical protein